MGTHWYKGPLSGNKKIKGLTADQALNFLKHERVIYQAEENEAKERERDAGISRSVKREITQWKRGQTGFDQRGGEESPIGGLEEASPESLEGSLLDGGGAQQGAPMDEATAQPMPTAQAQVPEDPISASLGGLGRQREQSALSELSGGLEQGVSEIPQSFGIGQEPQTQSTPIAPQHMQAGLEGSKFLEGLPEHLTYQAVWEFKNGKISGSKFVEEIRKLKEELWKDSRNEAERVHQEQMKSSGRDEEHQSKMDLEDKKGENALALARERGLQARITEGAKAQIDGGTGAKKQQSKLWDKAQKHYDRASRARIRSFDPEMRAFNEPDIDLSDRELRLGDQFRFADEIARRGIPENEALSFAVELFNTGFPVYLGDSPAIPGATEAQSTDVIGIKGADGQYSTLNLFYPELLEGIVSAIEEGHSADAILKRWLSAADKKGVHDIQNRNAVAPNMLNNWSAIMSGGQ